MSIRKIVAALVPGKLKSYRYDLSARTKLIRHLLKDYGWWNAFKLKKCIDRNGDPIPWFSYPAIDFLSELNFSEKTVFEYGSGFSTLFWGAHAKSVIAVENNIAWLEKIQPMAPTNCTILQSSLDVEEYSGQISAYELFDVVVVDGYIPCRAACSEKALKHLKPGGIIILDNADRCLGSAAILRNAGLIQSDFTGFAPLSPHAQTTSVFFSRDYNFEPLKGYQPHKSVAQPFDYPKTDY